MAKLNKEQKTRLKEALDKVTEARDGLVEFKDLLQETFDSRSERWQESEKADEYQELIDVAGENEDSLDYVMSALDELLQGN